jgi:hypothetical protein
MTPGGVWAKLSEADREIWDQLSDDTKLIILSTRSQQQNSRSGPHRPPGKRVVSLHDVIQACQHLTLDPGEDTPDVTINDIKPTSQGNNDKDHSAPSADLLTYATNQQAVSDNVPPAHLAKMMPEAINRHSKGINAICKSYVGINAICKSYVSILHHSRPPVLYSVSQSAHVTTYSGALIDGGSNGGLAGSEMRVIE